MSGINVKNFDTLDQTITDFKKATLSEFSGRWGE
jgi:hypothetical protein|tara:strand:- start:813 stop:914 length:102 start_codon:yes stop_codon:yes gene_type:complete